MTPLRRSARLSGAQEQSQLTAQVVSSTSAHSEDPEVALEGIERKDSDWPYNMELAVTPPRRVAAGLRLEAPLVVTFNAPKYKKREVLPRGMNDLSGIWAFISLTTEDRSQILAPPQQDLLKGKMADSIHPITQNGGRGQPFAYATFPGLSVSEPGRYCFKVNIIDMNQ